MSKSHDHGPCTLPCVGPCARRSAAIRVPKTWQAGVPDNVALLLFFLFWYVGNAFYNQYNTMALEGECAQTQDLVGLGLGAVPCDLQAPAASTAA